MHWRKLGLAALALPAAFVTIAATPSPSPIVLPPDPACIATTCPASPAPSPTSSVLSAGTGPSTPATGDGGPVVALLALPLIGLGAGAASWAMRRRDWS